MPAHRVGVAHRPAIRWWCPSPIERVWRGPPAPLASVAGFSVGRSLMDDLGEWVELRLEGGSPFELDVLLVSHLKHKYSLGIVTDEAACLQFVEFSEDVGKCVHDSWDAALPLDMMLPGLRSPSRPRPARSSATTTGFGT